MREAKCFATVMAFAVLGLIGIYGAGLVVLARTAPVRSEGMTAEEYLVSDIPWKRDGAEVVPGTLEEAGKTDGDTCVWFTGFFRCEHQGKEQLYRFTARVKQDRGGWHIDYTNCQYVPGEYLRKEVIEAKSKRDK